MSFHMSFAEIRDEVYNINEVQFQLSGKKLINEESYTSKIKKTTFVLKFDMKMSKLIFYLRM